MSTDLTSFSLSSKNKEWLEHQVSDGAFADRSDLVNHLIDLAREREFVRGQLIQAEQSVSEQGWVTKTPQQILAEFKEKARKSGKL